MFRLYRNFRNVCCLLYHCDSVYSLFPRVRIICGRLQIFGRRYCLLCSYSSSHSLRPAVCSGINRFSVVPVCPFAGEGNFTPIPFSIFIATDIGKLQPKSGICQCFVQCRFLSHLYIVTVCGFLPGTGSCIVADGFHIAAVQINPGFINRKLLCDTEGVELQPSLGIGQPEPQLFVTKIQF